MSAIIRREREDMDYYSDAKRQISASNLHYKKCIELESERRKEDLSLLTLSQVEILEKKIKEQNSIISSQEEIIEKLKEDAESFRLMNELNRQNVKRLKNKLDSKELELKTLRKEINVRVETAHTEGYEEGFMEKLLSHKTFCMVFGAAIVIAAIGIMSLFLGLLA